MGAQNFNFAPKFPEVGDFEPQMLYFGHRFSHKEKIFQHSEIKRAVAPCRGTTVYVLVILTVVTDY